MTGDLIRFLRRWFKKLAAQKLGIILLLAVILLLGGYFFFWQDSNGREVILVDQGTVMETINVSGQTRAVAAADLGFEHAGRIARVTAPAGAMVAAGQIIAALEAGDLEAGYLEARANLAAEKSRLAELERGTRPEELAVYEARAAEARKLLQDRTIEAYTLADDAVRNLADQMFTNPRSPAAELTFPTNDNYLRTKILSTRYNLEQVFEDWRRRQDDLPLAETNLVLVRDFLNLLSLAVNSVLIDSDTLSADKAAASAARTNINTAIGNLTATKEKDNLARQELVLKQAGSSPEERASQRARVEQAEAKVASLAAQLKQTMIIAPFAGLVARQEAKIGQFAAAGEILVTVLSADRLEVESFVPEVYIGRLRIGNEAEIILDALPETVFHGEVVYIESAETIQGGVPNYKIKIDLKEQDERFRSGLTANLRIATERRENVVRLPRFALTERDGNIFVYKSSGREIVLAPVEVGLIGTDGMVEIRAGLTAGEKVIVAN